MSDLEIDDRQMRQFVTSLAAVPALSGGMVRAALSKTAADIVASAKKASPVDTGNLRASISASPVESGEDGSFYVEVGPTAAYGVFVELGTSRSPAQPFLFPAAEVHSEALTKALESLAERAI